MISEDRGDGSRQRSLADLGKVASDQISKGQAPRSSAAMKHRDAVDRNASPLIKRELEVTTPPTTKGKALNDGFAQIGRRCAGHQRSGPPPKPNCPPQVRMRNPLQRTRAGASKKHCPWRQHPAATGAVLMVLIARAERRSAHRAQTVQRALSGSPAQIRRITRPQRPWVVC